MKKQTEAYLLNLTKNINPRELSLQIIYFNIIYNLN